MSARRVLASSLASLLAVAGLASFAELPASATPNVCTDVAGYFWSTEQDMMQAQGADCRSTFVDDPGYNQLLNRRDVLNAGGLYAAQGFDRQWLWYAPSTIVHVSAGSTLAWSTCPGLLRFGVGPCPTYSLGSSLISLHDFGGRAVDLHALAWDNRFIGLACGNNTVNVSGSDPVPTITGHKFNDLNRNGKPDPGEPGVAGVTFQLIRESSEFGDQPPGLAAVTTSDANGNFTFMLNGLGPGVYDVHEVVPAGWLSTGLTDQAVTVPAGIGNENVATLQFGNRAEDPPVANAGPPQQMDQTSAAGSSVTLDGSASYDPHGDPLTYVWTGPFVNSPTGTANGVHPTVTMPVGTHTVTLTVSDSDSVESGTATTQITVYPPITATKLPQSGVEGSALSGTVATFTDPDPAATATEYAATINWGDGTPVTDGTISKAPDGTFTVAGAHTYVDEGAYTALVTVTDIDNPFNTATVPDPVTVADASLTAAGVCGVSPNPVDQTVATFTDANPRGTVSDFTATVNWGDGTPATTGIISQSPTGTFAVAGSHTYATLGPKTITVHIVDDGGAQATANSCLIVYALPSGGDFVIGDLNATIGNHVTYWGAQWWKANQLSGGTAPAAYKGYENNPGATTNLQAWTTNPGNSSRPPTTVPSYMAVIVSSHITQQHVTISGDAPHIVIIATNPGYGPNPGHAGTGTVVAVLR